MWARRFWNLVDFFLFLIQGTAFVMRMLNLVGNAIAAAAAIDDSDREVLNRLQFSFQASRPLMSPWSRAPLHMLPCTPPHTPHTTSLTSHAFSGLWPHHVHYALR